MTGRWEMTGDIRVSDRIVERMRLYLRVLEELSKEGVTTVASRDIAERVGVKPGLLRKDLSHFGGFGRPSVGYKVAYLQQKIHEILRVDEVQMIAWVGARRLVDDPGLVKHLAENKSKIILVFDDREDVRSQIEGIPGLPFSEIEPTVREKGILSAVVAVAGELVQSVTDALVAGGVTAILNLSTVAPKVPTGITLHNLDIAGELMLLSYYSKESRTRKR